MSNDDPTYFEEPDVNAVLPCAQCGAFARHYSWCAHRIGPTGIVEYGAVAMVRRSQRTAGADRKPKGGAG